MPIKPKYKVSRSRGFNKGHYTSVDSYTIDISDLHTRTRTNLQVVGDHLGIDWDDYATVTPVPGSATRAWSSEEVKEYLDDLIPPEEQVAQWKARGDYASLDQEGLEKTAKKYHQQNLRYAKSMTKPGAPRKTFIIEGVGPNGEEAVYLRRETAHSSAGQTRLYFGKDNFPVSDVLDVARKVQANKEDPTLNLDPYTRDRGLQFFDIKSDLDWE